MLKRILTDIGWHLQGRILDTEEWRQVLLTPVGADLEKAWPWGKLLPGTASSTGSRSMSYYNAGPAPGYTTKSRFTAPRQGTYTFDWAATISTAGQSFQFAALLPVADKTQFYRVGLGLSVLRGGSFAGADGGFITGPGPVDTDVLPSHVRLDNGNTGIPAGSYGGTAISVYLDAGDVVQLAVFARRLLGDSTPAHRAKFIVNFSSAALTCTNYADDAGVSETLLYPARFLPPLKCTDVIRDFLVRVDGVVSSK